LPLLAVASDVRARDAEKRAAEQHDAVMDILRTVHETARLTAQAKSDVPDRRCAAQREDWMETVLAISRTNGGARSERTRPDALRPRR
jgi:hypothetical protein